MDADIKIDAESALYTLLGKAKKEGILKNISGLAEKCINLYTKRFGYMDYAKSIPENDFYSELIDCVEHLAATDKECAKIFEVFKTEEEQSLIVATISGIMIG